MKYSFSYPGKHFTVDDDPLTNIESLHILFWNKGICIAGYGPNASILESKTFLFDKDWSAQALEEIFVNEGMVAGPQPITHIWIAQEAGLMIPSEFYDAALAASWLKTFQPVNDEDKIKSTATQGGQIHQLFSVPGSVAAIIERYFPEAAINHLSGALLHEQEKSLNTVVELNLLEQTRVLTIWNRGELLLHRVCEDENLNDTIYKIALLFDENSLDQKTAVVNVNGFESNFRNSIDELQSYFPVMNDPGSEQSSTYILLSKLIACV